MEALLKIAAMGKDYFTTSWNLFDLVVVTASYIELFLSDFAEFSAFRTFRLVSAVDKSMGESISGLP